MIPRDTTYRLAHAPRDYARCHTLMREEGPPVKLGWPTVLAERDGKVIGFVSTQPRRDALVAGPLVLNGTPRPGIVVMRLAEAYDLVMRKAGVTSYLFHVDTDNAKWLEILKGLGGAAGFEILGTSDSGGTWLKRRL
jgi:hypothetical protein